MVIEGGELLLMIHVDFFSNILARHVSRGTWAARGMRVAGLTNPGDEYSVSGGVADKNPLKSARDAPRSMKHRGAKRGSMYRTIGRGNIDCSF